MKYSWIVLVSVKLLISCNSSVSNELGVRTKETQTSNDSTKVVSENKTWQELLEIDRSDLNIASIGTNTNSKFAQKERMKEATFGAGCFWCIEASFLDVKGVISVKPGYAGGKIENPTYEKVCTGTTGHAEVARINYDESIISFDQLLEMFWFLHDPTQLNRQGNDIGTQYRSVIFYHDEAQKEISEKYKAKLETEKVWDNPIVTEIVEVNNYYEAEKYHHNYLALNPENPYCQAIVRPKVDKFRKVFGSQLK
jgi:peptide-methionine (S)-S-oxide reductase